MAKQPMLKFVKIDRDMPVKRDADTRREDFDEIYAEFAAAKAEEPVQPVWRALLPVALPLAQQHPRLAASDRNRAA